MDQKRIDEYFKYKSLIKEANVYMKEVEKEALEAAEKLKETSKQKTFSFHGSNGNCIEVIEAEKLEMVSPTGLIQLLNDNADAFVKSEMKYSLDTKFAKLVKDFISGKYIDTEFEYAVSQVIDKIDKPETEKVLRKKLKGIFQKDKEILESFGCVNADEDAYLLQEAKAYSNVVTLAKAYNIQVEDFLSRLSSLLFVDTTLKVKATESED